jgi:hypothetical protein
MGGKGRRAGLADLGIRPTDKNLHLALLDAIQSSYSWLPEYEADYEATRNSHPTWPTWSAIRSNDDSHNAALEQYLISLELPAARLAKLKTLTLDGDRDVYTWIFFDWWHSAAEHFSIRDLSGIEHCTQLEYLSLDQVLTEGCSLWPLTKLTKLTELHISADGHHRDLDSLLEIPALEKLSVVNVRSSDERQDWERVCNALLDKGLPSLVRS